MNMRTAVLLFVLLLHVLSNANKVQAKVDDTVPDPKNLLLRDVKEQQQIPAWHDGDNNDRQDKKAANLQRQVIEATTTATTHTGTFPCPTIAPTDTANLQANNNAPAPPPNMIGAAAPPPTNPPTVAANLQGEGTEIPVLTVDGFDPDPNDTAAPTTQPTKLSDIISPTTLPPNPSPNKPTTLPPNPSPNTTTPPHPSGNTKAPATGIPNGPSSTSIPSGQEQNKNPTTTPRTATPTKTASPTVSPSVTHTSTMEPTSWSVFADTHDRDEVIPYKCNGMTTAERTNDIIQLIGNLSGPQTLRNVNSPHFRAFNWINRLDGWIACPNEEVGFVQRFVLAIFYFSMLGEDRWTNCDANGSESSCESEAQRWLGAESECNWYGVTCNQEGVVTHLDLQRNGLEGNLPVELFSLTAMQGLSLGHNEKIRGTIPRQISQWTQLQYLDLDYNDLEGDFPNVYQTRTLQAIDLNNNRFSGTISAAIGQLTKLVVLQIENNKFQGKLPLLDMAITMGELVLFSSQGNPWTEVHDWEALCDWVPDRREVDSPAYLQFLLADCSNDAEPTRSCSCCSVCF